MLRSTPLRPRRLRMGQLALGDAVRPVREVSEGRAAEVLDELVEHLFAGLPGLDAAEPRFFGSIELAQRIRYVLRERARGKLAQLMAADAAVVLHRVEPVALGYLGGNCALAAELARLRNLHHRIPIDRRIVLRRGRLVRRHHRLQIEILAGRGFDLRRIDQPVAAHPDVVIGFRQIGQHVTSLIVGDDHSGEPGGKIRGFRDHPDAGFRPLRAGDHAADIIVVDAH